MNAILKILLNIIFIIIACNSESKILKWITGIYTIVNIIVIFRGVF